MLNNKLAKAVRLAIAFGGASAAVFTANVSAAEEDQSAKEVERIQVTGSRINRADLEGVSPVTVLTNEDMKIEGNLTVADALRNSNLNSFGSFSERSGSSAQSQATINLRGAGSARTLVLIDGKRFPGSPTLGGASANLNALPMAAVERIEILTDGASSVYGSDAMAGVVNIIMKKDYEGIEFSTGVGKRDRDEGTTSNEFSVITGYQTEKGGITVAFDHQRRDGISDGDREFTAPWMRDLDGDGVIQAYSETDGWSIYGATVAAPDFSEAQAGLGCDALIQEYGDNVFKKVAADVDWSPGSTYCMYAYANVSYNKASINKNTMYIDADYELGNGVEWFGRAMFAQNESFGRYAPPAAAYRNMPADHPDNPYGEVTTGYYRWVGIGTRDGNVHDYNQDYLTGLRGELDWGNATWEVYYHYNKADNKSMGEYYLSYTGLAYNNANGIPLTSDEGIANMKATTLTQSKATFHQYNAGLNFDLFELPGGEAAHFFGMEYFDTVYSEVMMLLLKRVKLVVQLVTLLAVTVKYLHYSMKVRTQFLII
jgi:iron complex outermembrane receptor protein